MKPIFCLFALAVLAPQESAQDLLKGALAKAKDGKKRVLLTFGAPG